MCLQRRPARRRNPICRPLSCFGIIAPKGVLFYPCCGDDTREPIQLFIDRITEFHFADSRRFPTLPTAYVCPGIPAARPHRTNGVRFPHRGYIFDPTPVFQWAERDEPTHKEVWTVRGRPGETITLYGHKADGEETFNKLPALSVFYYRGDSPGEGGSGVWWLGPRLFHRILDKLVDGGLIVTDGSNPDPGFRHVPWNPLWETNRWWDLRAGEPEPKDLVWEFEYAGRRFIRLMECGYRYGPVYAWRVERIPTQRNASPKTSLGGRTMGLHRVRHSFAAPPNL